MANNWKIYQQTGNEGGKANNLIYVDSHNGSDVTGDGTHDAPLQSIQAASDLAASGTSSAADVVLAGVFEGSGVAGDIVGGTSLLRSFIAEGDVYFEGTGVSVFAQPFYSFNKGGSGAGSARFTNGRFIFKNFTADIRMVSTNFLYAYDCEFHNCLEVFNSGFFYHLEDLLFVDSNLNSDGGGRLLYDNVGMRRITFINSSFRSGAGANAAIKSCFFDSTSTFYIQDNLGGTRQVDYCMFEGTLTNKIRLVSTYYDNNELAQAGEPLWNPNGVVSTGATQLNQVNSKDFTLQETSVLKNGGDNGRQIGYFKVAKAIDASFSGWTGTTNIDNTTTPGEAILNGSPVGTMESEGIELWPKARKVTRINLPDVEFNSPLGEMVGNLASDNTPYLMDVEIQYSDDNVTYNGTWLRMAVGVQPMHDTTNDVGTDDPAYDITTAEIIVCRYMKFRITLRDNEIQV